MIPRKHRIKIPLELFPYMFEAKIDQLANMVIVQTIVKDWPFTAVRDQV